MCPSMHISDSCSCRICVVVSGLRQRSQHGGVSLAEMRSMLDTQGGTRQTVERLRELIHAPKFKQSLPNLC